MLNKKILIYRLLNYYLIGDITIDDLGNEKRFWSISLFFFVTGTLIVESLLGCWFAGGPRVCVGIILGGPAPHLFDIIGDLVDDTLDDWLHNIS